MAAILGRRSRATVFPKASGADRELPCARGTRGRRVYVLVDAEAGAGSTVPTMEEPHGFGPARIAASPAGLGISAESLWILRIPTSCTCQTWRSIVPRTLARHSPWCEGAPGGDDYHFLWIDPTAPSRMILATDQGTTISVDGAKTWTTWYNQPTAQIYHAITDSQFPYTVYGTQQDSGSVTVPSRTNHGAHHGRRSVFHRWQ